MSETTAKADRRAAGSGPPWLYDNVRHARSRIHWAKRRHVVPHLALGMLLVLACAGGFVLVHKSSDHRETVLALAREVRVGQTLVAADLREVDVAVDPSVAVVRADEVEAVVGKSVATNLPAGALLAPGEVGRADGPEPGYAIAALLLKPGRLPPGLAAGSSVSVVVAPDQPTGNAQTTVATWLAVVVDVSDLPAEQGAVVAVQLREAAAREVAAVPPGQLAIVLLPNGGR